MNPLLPWQQESIVRHSQQLLTSFHHWTGEFLLEPKGTPSEIARALFEAPFAVVSHGTEAEPIFNYGNRQALELWELSWEDFTRMPSRQSAEASEQFDRQRLLNEVAQRGFSANYSGIRISSRGRRFTIEGAHLWNVLDERGQYLGQAATFGNQ